MLCMKGLIPFLCKVLVRRSRAPAEFKKTMSAFLNENDTIEVLEMSVRGDHGPLFFVSGCINYSIGHGEGVFQTEVRGEESDTFGEGDDCCPVHDRDRR